MGACALDCADLRSGAASRMLGKRPVRAAYRPGAESLPRSVRAARRRSEGERFPAVMPRSRGLLCILLTWAVLAQTSLAAIPGTEPGSAGHGETEMHMDGGRHPQVAAHGEPHEEHGNGVSPTPASAACSVASQKDGPHHHGCDHACHACAQFLGLPAYALPDHSSDIRHDRCRIRATGPSHHQSPPDRPPRTIV